MSKKLSEPPASPTTSLISNGSIPSLENLDNSNHLRFSDRQRYFSILLIGISAFLSPTVTTIYYPSIPQMKKDLSASSTQIDISVSIFILTMAVAPLLWSKMSTKYGRKPIYQLSQSLFVIGCLIASMSQKIELFIFSRFLQGVGASAPVVVGAGTISDMFSREKQGLGLSLMLLGPLLGPTIGPILGGFFATKYNWRFSFYFVGGTALLCLIIISLFLVESLPVASNLNFVDYNQNKNSGDIEVLPKGNSYKDRFKAMVMKSNFSRFLDPPTLLLIFYSTIGFSAYVLVTVTQTRAMITYYGLTKFQVGLSYLPIGVGNIVGTLLTGFYSDYNFKKLCKDTLVRPNPKVRLNSIFFGIFVLVVSLALDGWFIQMKFHIVYTFFAQFFIGIGMMNITILCGNYLIDIYPTESAEITALANLIRYSVTAIIVSFASVILDKLEFNYTFTIFSALQILGFVIVWYVCRKL